MYHLENSEGKVRREVEAALAWFFPQRFLFERWLKGRSLRIQAITPVAASGPVIAVDSTVIDQDYIQSLVRDTSVPEGTPFLIDDDGDLGSVAHVNAYLLEASRQRAYAGDHLRTVHAPTLSRLLQHVRSRRDAKVDLTATEREDIVSYRDVRRVRLAAGSWNNELAILSSFFEYAVKARWIDRNPIPRWGSRQRSTLADRTSTHRRERHLTEKQLRFFLEAGLRGDLPADPDARPPYPERNYILGLLLATTGLRREEAVFLLDCEIPTPDTMPARGVHAFTRYGKGSRPRDIWITDTFADHAQLYRSTDREAIVARAQPALRRRVREESAVMTAVELDDRGRTTLIINGTQMRPELLRNDDRARAVTRRPDGTIEPLAFIVAEGGKPPALRSANHWFNEAADRVSLTDHPDRPPSHIDVTPHVMRHTFAVRMLAALIREGRETTGNPYYFLASPEFVVQQLLGHADIRTTLLYIRAAVHYNDELPQAFRSLVAATIGIPGGADPVGDDRHGD